MDKFLEWTDTDPGDARRLFTLAIKAGDRGAAERMREGVESVIAARFVTERGSEIGAGLTRIAGPLSIIASMDTEFAQAFGV